MDMSKKDEMLKKYGLIDKTEFTDQGEVIHLVGLESGDEYTSFPNESFDEFMTRIIGWCFNSYD